MSNRNAPCPCGSKKKFKQCCEGSVTFNVKLIKEAETKNPGSISRMIAALDEHVAGKQS